MDIVVISRAYVFSWRDGIQVVIFIQIINPRGD
jgi:hypothetical protein